MKLKYDFNWCLTYGILDKEKTVPPTVKEAKDTSNNKKVEEKSEKVQRKRSSVLSKSQNKVLPPPKRPIRPSKIIQFNLSLYYPKQCHTYKLNEKMSDNYLYTSYDLSNILSNI